MDRIDKDVGINALRQVRENIEEAVATASQEIVQYRHTVQAQAARIAELEQAVAIQEDIATESSTERTAELEAQIERNVSDYDHVCDQVVQACARVDELEHELRQQKETTAKAYRGIDRLTERCSELTEERDIFSNQAEEFQKRMGEYRDACQQYEEKIAAYEGITPRQAKFYRKLTHEPRYHEAMGMAKDGRDAAEQALEFAVTLTHRAEARAHNVMRLAAAADHHLQHGRAAIARCYLTPLMEGKHDANGYDETAGNSRETRPEPDDKDNGGNTPAWRVPEGWDIVRTCTD